MSEPFSYLAYEPKGPGLMCAVMVIVEGENVYGWYTGPVRDKLVAAFFMLEHYYSTHETALYHSVDDDVYGEWVLTYPPVEIDAGRYSPVPEPLGHALERAQDAFAADWLFYCDDPAAAADVAWYREHNRPLKRAGIRHGKLNKFEQGQIVWTYASPGMDLNVIDFLRLRWPLDYALAP
ncbi:hypothetical protein J8I34_28145 [Cupriavidus sp. AcVe19-6a]|nr:hypothetical protein [Cupriavidus sp. AcVe19-1a]MBP0639198.1 hypothetical protein [Cupriavidus sp. AcVe19-6a]